MCWVNVDGLVEVPKVIRDELGLRGGGGVFFVKRKDTGKVDEYVITGTPAQVQGQAGRIPAKKD